MTYLQRKVTQRTVRETKEWIDLRICKRREYLPPRKPGLRSHLRREWKAVAARYYQLLTGHALIAPFMKERLKKVNSDQFWWCRSSRRQTREHLFKECAAWKAHINRLWRQVGRKLGWRHPRMIKVFCFLREEKITPDVLQFLRILGSVRLKRLRGMTTIGPSLLLYFSFLFSYVLHRYKKEWLSGTIGNGGGVRQLTPWRRPTGSGKESCHTHRGSYRTLNTTDLKQNKQNYT